MSKSETERATAALLRNPKGFIGTSQERQASLINVHTVGHKAYWVECRILFEIDLQGDWTMTHSNFWEWYQNVIEANGFERPSFGEHRFYRMVRLGHLMARCEADEIPTNLLLSVGSTKADIIWRHAKESDRDELRRLLQDATEQPREHVERQFTLDNRRKTRDGQPGEARPVDPGQLARANDAELAKKTETKFDASAEPGPSTPVPPDDRPHGESRYQCPCGRTHVIVGSVIDHRIESNDAK